MTIDLEATGRRVETLLDMITAADAAAGDAAEQLVRELLELYGAALERLIHELRQAAPERCAGLADDPLLSGLLSLHGLHPAGVGERVQQALADLRPQLEPRGADAVVLVADRDRVRLRLEGTDGCATDGLRDLLLDSIRAAVPDVADVEVTVADPTTATGLIHPDTLFVRPAGALGSVP